MKNKKINIKIIAIIVLIGIIIGLIIINLNNKNTNIEKQEIEKEQLGEVTGDNAYVSMETHLTEVNAKQKELDNINNTIGQTTATASQILKDYTAYKDGKLITGTMANNGAVTKSLSVGESYTIPVGYHNGSGKVTNVVTNKGILTLESTNSTAVDITDGYYTHVNTTAVYNAGYTQGTNDSIANRTTAVKLGTGTAGTTFTMSVTDICPNYADLTAANFLMELNTIKAQVGWNTDGWDTMVNGYSKSYDSTTGTISISLENYYISSGQNQGIFNCTFSVWLVNA